MTIGVKIVVHSTENATAVLYETSGNNKKRVALKTFSAGDTEWEGHIWKGRDLVIEEEEIKQEPSQAEEA